MPMRFRKLQQPDILARAVARRKPPEPHPCDYCGATVNAKRKHCDPKCSRAALRRDAKAATLGGGNPSQAIAILGLPAPLDRRRAMTARVRVARRKLRALSGLLRGQPPRPQIRSDAELLRELRANIKAQKGETA